MNRLIKNIIAIDDSSQDLALYTRIIEKTIQCNIHTYSDPEEALLAIENQNYDVILLDYHMPKLNGLEFINEFDVRKIKLKGPILALTGQENIDVAVKFLQKGAAEYLEKEKINAQTLPARIYKALQNFREKKIEEEKQSELSLFAHTVAHDLKAPLGRITSYARLLKKKSAELNMKYINNIENDASFIADFLDNLMLYAEFGRPNIKKVEVNLNDIVQKAIENLEIQISEKDVEIRYGQLSTVIGNKVSFIQLFQNLISNSIKYCKKSPVIRISSKVENEKVVVRFIDNGIGIPADMAKTALQPFSRIPNNLAEKGTGLGLALCNKIVKQHGGTIEINQPIEGGTEFYISLPMQNDNLNSFTLRQQA